jgi:hypothetical protein
MTQEPSYEVTNYETLNKFLLGTLRDIRKKEIAIEEAQAISQISDKIIKNNLTMIMEAKRIGSNERILFFEPSNKQVMIG